MAHIHIKPATKTLDAARMARRLGMRLVTVDGAVVMETPHHRPAHTNANVVRFPKRRHQLGPAYTGGNGPDEAA